MYESRVEKSSFENQELIFGNVQNFAKDWIQLSDNQRAIATLDSHYPQSSPVSESHTGGFSRIKPAQRAKYLLFGSSDVQRNFSFY